MLTVKLIDQGVQTALERLLGLGQSARAVYAAVGETLLSIAKRSFSTSTAPDGTPWAVNSAVTLARYLGLTGGNYKKNGDLSKKGEARLASKKPLIGQSRDLSRQMHWEATDESVTLANSMIYAAMQQFGGTVAKFDHLWGDIPARPFFPITPDGQLMPDAAVQVQQLFIDYIETLIG